MALNSEQHNLLLKFVASVTPDQLDCDDCFELVPELAESQLGDRPLTEILEDVQTHLQNCPCCAQEYETFLKALETLPLENL